MAYINFENNNNNTDELKKRFLKETKTKNLRNILKEHENKVKIKIYKCVEVENVYLIMLVGKNDTILIKLGKKYGFPRGYPILWIPGEKMQTFGFFPKFENDDRKVEKNIGFKSEEIENIKFFKKWSGFLGQVLAFKINNKKYWTVTSKNNADKESEYIKDTYRLFKDKINNEVLEMLIKNNYHICAEIISKNDQVHGARVINESPVITAIGKGRYFDIKNNKELSEHDKYVLFLDNVEIVKLCNKYKLPCDSAIKIYNHDCIKYFLDIVNLNRDFMTNSLFNNIISVISSIYPNGIKIEKGTISHKNILGDCCEGLVLNIKSNNNYATVKYKFAEYVIRTMLLREEFKNFSFNSDLKNKVKRFTNFWCVSKEGENFWYKFGLKCLIYYYKNFNKLDSSNIGLHIQIAEIVSTFKNLNDVDQEFEQLLGNKITYDVILCIGPIGSGKSTISNYLFKNIPNSSLIDGDILDIGPENVKILSNERNDYTRWKIIESLMNGLIPIVSVGGGVLFSTGKKSNFILIDQIRKCLGINIRLITLVPTYFDDIFIFDKKPDLTRIFNDKNIVVDTIINRINRGEWIKDPKFKNNNQFANFIFNKSSKNLRFANDIIYHSDLLYGFPLITSSNFSRSFNSSIITDILSTPHPIPFGKFGQIRLLTKIIVENEPQTNMIKHITWSFNKDKNISFSIDDFVSLLNLYPPYIKGTFYTLSTKDLKYNYKLVIPEYPIHDNKNTHITIFSGDHFPVESLNIVTGLQQNHTSFSILSRNSGLKEYTIINQKPCDIQILSSFGI